MTASPEGGAKSLSFRRKEPRQRKAGRRKLNVFATGEACGRLMLAGNLRRDDVQSLLRNGETSLWSNRIAFAQVPDHAPEPVGFSAFDHLQRR